MKMNNRIKEIGVEDLLKICQDIRNSILFVMFAKREGIRGKYTMN